MYVELEIVEGPMAGMVFRLEQPGLYVFGRGEDVQCRLNGDTTVSRRHFALEVDPPRARLLDLGGANGLWLNGHPLARGAAPEAVPVPGSLVAGGDGSGGGCAPLLANGDRIHAGESTLLVRAPQAEEGATILIAGGRAPEPSRGGAAQYNPDTGLFSFHEDPERGQAIRGGPPRRRAAPAAPSSDTGLFGGFEDGGK